MDPRRIKALARRAEHHMRLATAWERLAREGERRKLPTSVVDLCWKKAATSCRCIDRITEELKALTSEGSVAA